MSKKYIITGGSLVAMLIVATVLLFYSMSESEEIKELGISIDTYIERADAYFLEGKYEEAISKAKKAIELNPDDPRGYSILANSYARQGNYSEAMKASENQLKIEEAKDIIGVGTVTAHAALLEVAVGQDEAIKFLEGYREMFPETVKLDAEGLKKAKAEGTLYYPYYR